MEAQRSDPRNRPAEIGFSPVDGHRLLPVEVVDRSSVVRRTPRRSQQRPLFNLLMIGTDGAGVHEVDFEPVPVEVGTLLRVHPGQVHRFVRQPEFDAVLVLWPPSSRTADRLDPDWYPGCGRPTRWQLEPEHHRRLLGWVQDLRVEQGRFDGSRLRTALMDSLLRTLLIRLAVELPGWHPSTTQLPAAYVAFRQIIERRLSERPTVANLASELGYSPRTIDRACEAVVAKTAKEVLDERTALEIRRLLTHSDRSIALVGTDLGFSDPSNFAKFTKRHLNATPGQVRHEALDTDPPDGSLPLGPDTRSS